MTVRRKNGELRGYCVSAGGETGRKKRALAQDAGARQTARQAAWPRA
ncbi:hypothetical protein [Klebsiella oxytoca]|nr:hypothetical protein [Klebsiella oxytoca]